MKIVSQGHRDKYRCMCNHFHVETAALIIIGIHMISSVVIFVDHLFRYHAMHDTARTFFIIHGGLFNTMNAKRPNWYLAFLLLQGVFVAVMPFPLLLVVFVVFNKPYGFPRELDQVVSTFGLFGLEDIFRLTANFPTLKALFIFVLCLGYAFYVWIYSILWRAWQYMKEEKIKDALLLHVGEKGDTANEEGDAIDEKGDASDGKGDAIDEKGDASDGKGDTANEEDDADMEVLGMEELCDI